MKRKCNHPGRPLGTALLIGVASVGLWALLEGGLVLASFWGKVFTEDDRPGQLVHQPFFQPHAQWGWSPVPNLNARDPRHGTPVRTGPEGVRLTPTARSEGWRIVCSGDSFTFGDQVGDDETWCARLAQIPQVARTLNFGVSGYGLDQSFLRFRDRMPRYDVHVLGLILDDIARMKFRQSPFGPLKPVLRIQEGELVSDTQWITASRPLQWLYRRAHLLHLLPSMNWLLGPRAVYQIEERERDSLFQLTEEILSKMKQDAEGRNARFVVLLFPTRSEVLHGARGKDRYRLLQSLRKQQIEVVDYYQSLGELSVRELKRAYFEDGHFTAEGHGRVARELGAYLTRESQSLGERPRS